MAKESAEKGGDRGREKLEGVVHSSVAAQQVAMSVEEHNVVDEVVAAAEVAGTGSDGEEPVVVEYLQNLLETVDRRCCCGNF